MATQTPNLGLTKPQGSDYVRVEDFNGNADVLDADTLYLIRDYRDLE